jgi:hypothetical protein
MSKENKNEYLLMFRGTDWHHGLSPQEIQEVLVRFKSWFDELTTQGKVKGGNPLVNEGKVVSGKNGRVVADGPFAESKEAIGGYFLVEVESQDEAVAIARNCPALAYGGQVEVRQIAPECPVFQELKEKLAEAQLANA